MRNLKNFKHWIAELRDLAVKERIFKKDNEFIDIKTARKLIVSSDFIDEFKAHLTPAEALDQLIESLSV